MTVLYRTDGCILLKDSFIIFIIFMFSNSSFCSRDIQVKTNQVSLVMV